MYNFDWKSDYSTGISEFDDYTKDLLNILKTLYTYRKKLNKESLDTCLQSLSNIMKHHLEYQECILAKRHHCNLYAYEEEKVNLINEIDKIVNNTLNQNMIVSSSEIVLLKNKFLNTIKNKVISNSN